MVQFRRRRHAPILVLALALAVAVAATATADKGTTGSATATLSGSGPASATAKCGVGKRATGAGFAIAEAFNPKTDTGTRGFIQSLARTSSRSFTGVASVLVSDSPATPFKTFVRCIRSTKGPVAHAEGSQSVAPGVIFIGRATCTGDYKAVGGGFRVNPPYTPPSGGKARPFVLESRRVGAKVWQSTLLNPAPFAQAPAEFTYWALCEPIGAPRTIVRKKTVVLPPDRRRGVATKCPRRWHTASGGFRLGPISNTDVMFAFADRSRPLGARGWSAGAWALPEAIEEEGGTLTVYAYCKHN